MNHEVEAVRRTDNEEHTQMKTSLTEKENVIDYADRLLANRSALLLFAKSLGTVPGQCQ